MLLSQVHVVLVETSEPMNVGGVARAMKNFGLSRLTLVSPRTTDWVTARRVAVHAEDLLESPRVVETLPEALASASWVVGTTSRIVSGRDAIAPHEAAAVAEERLDGGAEIAFVFGSETSGLSNAQLARCHTVSTIPSGTEQPSFNLAQAVMLYAYELHLALTTPANSPSVERVAEAEIEKLAVALRAALNGSGFVDLDRPRHGLLELMQPWRRASLTPDEARLWRSALFALATPRSPPRPSG